METFKGGKTGCSGAKFTQLGEYLLREYRRVENYVGEILGDEEYWEAVGLKIIARTRLKGIVKSVEKGDVVAKVKVEINAPATITALISTGAVEDLDIKAGDEVEASLRQSKS